MLELIRQHGTVESRRKEERNRKKVSEFDEIADRMFKKGG